MKPKRNRKTRASANRRSAASQKKTIREERQLRRVVTRTIDQFPRCFAYLKAMHVRLDDPAMHDYWFASILSDSFSDERLEKVGTVNFDTMGGRQLLKAFEAILAGGSARKKQQKLNPVLEVDKIRGAASEEEIIAAMTPKGGWKAATLAQWGIGWPPPQGWRRRLIENFEARAE